MKLELRRVTVRTERAQDARRSWPERETLLITLTDAQGVRGVGEASPLPGYSPDALDDVQRALAALDTSPLQAALELPIWTALGAVASLLPASLPSGRMGLETAALDWLGQRSGLSAPLLLGGSANGERPLAKLLGPASSDALAEDADQAVRAGFRHVKIKLGAEGQLDRELSGIQSVHQRLGAQVSLRLDANGVLSAAHVARAWSSLSAIGIELFEEPGSVPPELLGALPLALDESLQGLDEASATSLLRERQARCLVLKPMTLGGLAHCWRMAARAKELGAGVVISHSFDGPYASRAAAALALALPAGLAHGLAPHAGLSGWPAIATPVSAGWLKTWSQPGLGLPAELEDP